MADGSHSFTIDAPHAERMRDEAARRGLTLDEYLEVLLRGPVGHALHTPSGDMEIARRALETGDYLTLDQFSAWMQDFGRRPPSRV